MPYRAHKAYSSIKRKNQQLRHLRDSGFLLLPVPHPQSVETGGEGDTPKRVPRSPPEAKHRGRKNRSRVARSPSGLPRAELSPGFLTAGVVLAPLWPRPAAKLGPQPTPKRLKTFSLPPPFPKRVPLNAVASAQVGRARPPGRVKEKILLEKQPLSSKG